MLAEFVQEIKNIIRKEICGIHTAIPGTITAFDPKTGLASVLPSMKFAKPDGSTIPYPQITGVPVLFPQGSGQNATVAFPVKKGDGCLIIVSERPIDFWLYGQETESDLKYDLSNAICIPGLFAKANEAVKDACSSNSIIVKNKETKITVSEQSAEIQKGNVKLTVSEDKVLIDGDLKVTGTIEADNI